MCRETGGPTLLAKVYSCAVVGLDGVLVEVEVDVGSGKPGMVLVGLPDAAVQESNRPNQTRFLVARRSNAFSSAG